MASYKIPLNASNYVSPERKKSFQEALEDDHRVRGSGPGEPREPAADRSPSRKPAEPPSFPASATTNSPLLESVTSGMSKFSDHQQRTMEIHEQYLRQQSRFAELFSQVLEHQESLLQNADNGKAGPMVDNLHRSLEQFHQIQDRGLQVHQQFLEQSAANARSFVNLLETQHRLMENGAAGAQSAPRDLPAGRTAEPGGTAEPAAAGTDQPPAAETQASAPEPQPPEPAPEHTSPSQAGTGVSLEELSSALLEIVAEKTGYPADMLELGMDMEADLGIDSIKRVEILGALEDRYPQLPQPDTDALAELRTLGEVVEYMDDGFEAPPAAQDESKKEIESAPPPAPASRAAPAAAESHPADSGPARPDLDQLTDLLLQVVAEKTGYPADMLELEMDMEADLGIDSIKRVEILGAMEEQVPDLPPFDTDTLAEMRTLGQIVEVMGAAESTGTPDPHSAPGPKKKDQPPGLTVNAVRARELPPPDHYQFSVPEDRPLVVTDDGSALTRQLTGMLASSGWKVVVWQFTDRAAETGQEGNPGDHPRVVQDGRGPGAVRKTWQALIDQHGSPIGLLHIHPSTAGIPDFHPGERIVVKELFTLAGLFDQQGRNPQKGERSLFMTVTREDGRLGTAGTREHFHESSGLPGLIKTLRWEWPDVFCRAVDLDPGMDLEAMSTSILAELHDPDRGLTEVGISRDSRITLTKDQPI